MPEDKSLSKTHKDFLQAQVLLRGSIIVTLLYVALGLYAEMTDNALLEMILPFASGLIIIILLAAYGNRERELEKAYTAERLKSSFFAMMSHEIRTPINGIMGTLGLLLESNLDDSQKHLAMTARSSADGLLGIINDILDYSKIEAGKLELEPSDFRITDLTDSIIELMQPLARSKGLKLSCQIDPHLPEGLHTDLLRVKQILLNFISNAVKFTDKGAVTLRIIKDEKNNLRCEVADTGIGINPTARQKLFKEFSQVDGSKARRFAGTGLGLAICQRLIVMMDGQIGVNSTEGQGSTFWFTIPLHPSQGPLGEKHINIVPFATDYSARILLVEDNPTNQMIARAFLQKGGHFVDTANNGLEAVAAVKKAHYDLVLMDISMPEMDGLEATKIIRNLDARFKDLPIIAMTAHAMRGDREECLQAGMNDYITKPVTREALLEMVQKWGQLEAEVKARLLIYDEDAAMNPESHKEISEEHFKQILGDLGPENIPGFAKVFYADIRKISADLQNAFHHSDWPNVKIHAHSLKSSTLSFGLAALSKHAAEIESQCKKNGKVEASLLQSWSTHLETAIGALNERFVHAGLPAIE